MESVHDSWRHILHVIFANSNVLNVFDEDNELPIFPPRELVFNAFSHFEFNDLKVVIIGQDCYHGAGQAHGLCFSVPVGVTCPPSLRNIFKELQHEYGVTRTNCDLTDWARQGVLLLNSALTVREGCPGSHLKLWQPYTRRIIEYISAHAQNIVYILWGAHAQSYAGLIDAESNLVLRGIHPSPLAARSGSFVGNMHFRLANEYLDKNSKEIINWL